MNSLVVYIDFKDSKSSSQVLFSFLFNVAPKKGILLYSYKYITSGNMCVLERMFSNRYGDSAINDLRKKRSWF